MTYSWSPIVALALFASVQCCNGQAVDGGPSPAVSDATSFPGLWISDLFYKALSNFTVRGVGSSACQGQSVMYDRHLQNYTSWAVKMAESWDRRPIGILTGNRYHLGIYDECVQVKGPLRGQYCVSEIKLVPTEKDYSFNRTEDKDYFGNNHAWHTLLGWVDYPDQIPRNMINLGICIPDSCTASDLQTTLQKELNNVFIPEHFKAVVKVDPIMCTVSGDMYPINATYYITSVIILLLVLICCVTTLYHYILLSKQQNSNKASEDFDSYFSSFSIIKSGKELFKFDKNNELNILNGFKFITMLFVLFGHRFMFLAGHPITYTEQFETIYIYGPDILLTSMNLVDPFFFMSGYLLYLTISPVFKKSGSVWMKLASPIVYRVLRMLPAYCAMMAITAHIVPHLGDGPLWPQRVWNEAENCKNYWWTNLLFISNFIDAKYQCLLVSWYISCDLQFFIIGIIILYMYMKNNKIGFGLFISMLCISLSIPVIVTYLTKGDGILKVHVPFLENPRNSKTFNDAYRPSYMRGTPFFVGIICAITISKLKERKIKLSQTTIYVGTFIMTIISVWAQLYGAIFYKRQRPYYPIEQAVYSTLCHCTWTVLCAWIAVCHFTTGYGPIAQLLSNRLLVPLGRLSYSVFLVNLVVMAMSQSSVRIPTYPTIMTLLNAWIYDTFKCYIMAMALYFIVEAPFGDVIRNIFGRGPKKVLSDTNETPIENINKTVKLSGKESSYL